MEKQLNSTQGKAGAGFTTLKLPRTRTKSLRKFYMERRGVARRLAYAREFGKANGTELLPLKDPLLKVAGQLDSTQREETGISTTDSESLMVRIFNAARRGRHLRELLKLNASEIPAPLKDPVVISGEDSQATQMDPNKCEMTKFHNEDGHVPEDKKTCTGNCTNPVTNLEEIEEEAKPHYKTNKIADCEEKLTEPLKELEAATDDFTLGSHEAVGMGIGLILLLAGVAWLCGKNFF